MALDDIKNAGVLAEFTRWGWTHHGLIAGGVIGATGFAHAQPLDEASNGNNVGWLIDCGLPAITLTPDEVLFNAANNIEWRNYALIAGGYAYGKYIGNETYIHIDEAGSAWRVALAYSFPAADTLRITATLSRFGYLRIDGEYTAPSPVVKTVDVACTWIHLSDPFPSGEGNYGSRSGKLQDVYTNGSKAMIGVFLRKEPGFGFDFCDDLYSCIELTITGVGRESGAALVLSAAETIPYTSLREQPLAAVAGINTYANIYARYAFYDPAGIAKVVRMKFDVNNSDGSFSYLRIELLENSTVIDEFGWHWISGGSYTTYGSLAAYIPPPDPTNGVLQNTNIGNVIYPWRSIWDNRYEISISYLYPGSATNIWFFGLHRLPSKAAVFVATNDNAVVHYGLVSTPIGAKTTALTATRLASAVNFAFQRKTGDFSFALNPICYV